MRYRNVNRKAMDTTVVCGHYITEQRLIGELKETNTWL